MYSKQEASLLTRQFWTVFGAYLSPVLSAEDEKINWVNYKTGKKGIRFTMSADNKTAKISIHLSHPDETIQQWYFDQFSQLKKIFQQFTGEEWQWNSPTLDEHGKTTGEIYMMLDDVSILNKSDWPAIISFFKSRLIALDAFWCGYRYAFDEPRF